MWEGELEKEIMIWTSMDTNQKARTYMSLKRFIKSLLKEQREICGEMYEKNTNTAEINTQTTWLIKNVKIEPTGKK